MNEPSVKNLKILAFLFAERVVIDQITGRHTLVGVFDIMELEKEQKIESPWFVYVSARGEIMFSPTRTADIKLSISREGDEERSMFRAEGTASAPEGELTNVQVHFAIPIPSIGISQGKYTVSIVVNANLIATRTLIVNGDRK